MKKLSNKGFTLVELIIVIAILAIIMLIAIPNFSGIQQRMQVRADKATAAQIGKAVRIWYTDFTTDKSLGKPTDWKKTEPTIDGGTHKATAVGNYYPQDIAYVTGTAADDAVLAPTRYECLKDIDKFEIAAGLTPSSLRSDKKLVDTQAYGIFMTGDDSNYSSKVVVVIYDANASATTNKTIDASTTDKITETYDGEAAGIAYIEP